MSNKSTYANIDNKKIKDVVDLLGKSKNKIKNIDFNYATSKNFLGIASESEKFDSLIKLSKEFLKLTSKRLEKIEETFSDLHTAINNWETGNTNNDKDDKRENKSNPNKETKTTKQTLKEKIKALLAGGHYKKANKAYQKLQKLMGKKEAKSWMNKAIKSTNAKATIYGGAVVSISKAVKSIKAKLTTSLSENKVKKSNKYYSKLTKLLGKKESKKAVEKIIKSTGAAVCISSSKIASLVKTEANDTGTKVTSSDNVESLDANQLRDKAVEYVEFKNEESGLRDSHKAVLYEKAITKINDLDISDPDYNQKVEDIKEEIREGCRNEDAKWEQAVQKLSVEYSKYGDDLLIQEQEINNNLEGINEVGFQNVLSSKDYGIKRLSIGENDFNNALLQKQEEVRKYNESITNNVVDNKEQTIIPTDNQTDIQTNNKTSNESVVTEIPVSQSEQTPITEQKINYNKISSSTSANNNTSNTEPANNVETSTVEENTTNASVGTNTDTVIETEKNTTTGKIKDITDIAGSSSTVSSTKKSSGAGAVIPAILGVGAVGAAGVAGVRYVKNRKQNVDIDESYDDENNSEEFADSNTESEYMKDEYLGPAGTEYMDASNYEASSDSDNIVPDNNSYTDAGNLETDDYDDDFSNDEAFNELN